MTKQELINAISQRANVSKVGALASLDVLAQLVADDLANGFESVIPGIGKLVPIDKPARTGRNPATGETLQIPASRGIKFKAAKAIKDAVS